MKKITILLCAIMTIPFMLCSCFEQNSIMEISLDKTEATMTVGDSMELTVSFTPENASVVLLDWKSSDSKVASVSYGIVKAKNAGTTVVTVKTEYGNKKSCNRTHRFDRAEQSILNLCFKEQNQHPKLLSAGNRKCLQK